MGKLRHGEAKYRPKATQRTDPSTFHPGVGPGSRGSAVTLTHAHSRAFSSHSCRLHLHRIVRVRYAHTQPSQTRLSSYITGPASVPAPAEPSAAEAAGERALKRLGVPGPLVLPPRSPAPRTEAARAVRAPTAPFEPQAVQGIPQLQSPPDRDGRSPRLNEPGGPHGPAGAAPPPRPPPQARAPPGAAGPGGPNGGRSGRGRGWGRRGRQARPPLTGSREHQQAEDAALEGSGLGLGALQLCALHLDVSGRTAPQPSPRTRVSPAAPATAHPGRPDRPPGPVPCTAAGRPGRRGAARTESLGLAVPKSAPSGRAPAEARACAVGDTAMRAARARGARERVGPGLCVGRDGAVPLLRRRMRGGCALLRPGSAAPAPAAARAAGEGTRAALLPPDGLRGRSVFPGHAQPLPHGARAVGARVRLRVTLPHRSRPDGGHFPCPDGTHSPACQTPRQTAHAQKMPPRPRDSCDDCEARIYSLALPNRTSCDHGTVLHHHPIHWPPARYGY